MNNSSTLQYYKNFAQEYSEQTLSKHPMVLLNEFMTHLPLEGHILDVGCGSGRDSLYFIQRGFNVTAFDGCKELAHLASKLIAQPVQVKSIQEMNWVNQFDGVWAMASLLHLKKHELPQAIMNCVKSLKVETSGQFLATFKSGQGGGYDDRGRFFSYYQPDELQAIFSQTGFFDDLTFIETQDSLGRNDITWLNIRATKKAHLALDYPPKKMSL